MDIEDLLEEEFQKLEEQFASAVNFSNRLSTRGSTIGPEGIKAINRLRLDMIGLFKDFSKTVEKLAEKDLKSGESKEMIAKKAMQNPDEVAKVIFERIFKEIEKL